MLALFTALNASSLIELLRFFLQKLQKMLRKRRRLEKHIKRSYESTDYQNYKIVLTLYICRLRKLKTYFSSKKLAELDIDHNQLHKNHQFVSHWSKVAVYSGPADAKTLFSVYFVNIRKIRSDIKPSATHWSTLMLRAPMFCNFQPAVEITVCTLFMESKRSTSPAYPIPVLLLFNIIDSICPAITVAINSSIATGIVPEAFKSTLFWPI